MVGAFILFTNTILGRIVFLVGPSCCTFSISLSNFILKKQKTGYGKSEKEAQMQLPSFPSGRKQAGRAAFQPLSG
jgi:hypothetical protein